MKNKLILLLIGIFLASCATHRQNNKDGVVTIGNKFDTKEVKWFKNSGSGKIKGVSMFKSKDGELHFGEGFRIELMPYSKYTKERLGHIYKHKKSGFVYADGIPKFDPDPEAYHDTIKAYCDKDGKFEFNNLPPGEYYIIAFMMWQKDQKTDGGGIMKRLVLSEGELKNVEMQNF